MQSTTQAPASATHPFDVQHRDCFESLAAMRDAGGADLILTSPPYPDARKPEAYGAEFDTSLAGYGRLGDAVFAALKPGGVCAIVIDGPVRQWRKIGPGQAQADAPVGNDSSQSERSLIAAKVLIDWSERIGFRHLEHCAYVRDSGPGKFDPRWRAGWEPVHLFQRTPGDVCFDRHGYTLRAVNIGQQKHPKMRAKHETGKGSYVQGETRCITTALFCSCNPSTIDQEHQAPFSRDLADAYVRCYGPPGGIIGDPFVGSGTVAFAVHRAGDGRRFIGGDLGIRQTHNGKPCGRRWADIVNDGLRQGRLFS
jgi:hypothetical protein